MHGSVFSLRVKEPFSHLSAVTAFHCATKCRFPLQAVFVVQFLLLSIYWSSYTDSSCQESAFLLLASYDTHLDQLMIIANFQHFCNFCFKCKCVFPVFHKQVFFQLWFYSLFWFLPYSWCDRFMQLLSTCADDVRIKARCSSWSQPLPGCSRAPSIPCF